METGHFTQMVWRSTTQLGCAVAACPGFTFIVCRWVPSNVTAATLEVMLGRKSLGVCLAGLPRMLIENSVCPASFISFPIKVLIAVLVLLVR